MYSVHSTGHRAPLTSRKGAPGGIITREPTSIRVAPLSTGNLVLSRCSRSATSNARLDRGAFHNCRFSAMGPEFLFVPVNLTSNAHLDGGAFHNLNFSATAPEVFFLSV